MERLQPHPASRMHGAPLTEFVWFPRSMLSALAEEARLHEPEETGGILVGHYTVTKSNGKRDAVITDVIGPGPAATRSRVSFEPDTAWQATELARIYAERDRRVSYLGDWHTHPTAQPIPSFRDLETLGVIAAHSPARCPEPLMAILGKEAPGQHWKIAVCQQVAAGQIRQIAPHLMPEASQEQAASTIDCESRPRSVDVTAIRGPRPQYQGCSMSSSEAKQQGL